MMQSLSSIYQSEQDFVSIVACPSCQRPLALESIDHLVCNGCARVYPQQNGIWNFLLPDQQARYQPFLDDYHQLRCGDGWERQDDAYYLNLPEVAKDDPQAAIWRIRRRTFSILKNHLASNTQAWLLDLGAGNCWLSHHLALVGYRVLALDVNVEGRDGLGGGRVYLEKGNSWFLRGQASMERLPVHDRKIALCVVSGAIHNANLNVTLKDVFRSLKLGGQLIIMDSPVYRDNASGVQMMREQLARFKLQYGFDEVPVEGKGYLVLDEIISALRRIGFSTIIRWPELPGSRFLRQLRRRTLSRRENARFPLFISSKPFR